MPTTVAEHPEVSDAQDRVVELRERKRELQEELRQARSTERDVDELAAEYDGSLDRNTRDPAEIRKELKVVRSAMVKARNERSQARSDAQAEILEELAEPYREAQRRLARQVRALLQEAEAEREIREEARERGLKPAAINAFHPLPERVLRDWLKTAESDYDI